MIDWMNMNAPATDEHKTASASVPPLLIYLVIWPAAACRRPACDDKIRATGK
jgi:hypothetical protein